MPFVAGESVGPYRILEQLGQGGMATVYKAFLAALDRYVAVKALHPALLKEPNFLARFQREAKVVSTQTNRSDSRDRFAAGRGLPGQRGIRGCKETVQTPGE